MRELENEITRADALSGDRIGVADLSPQVAAAGDAGAAVADDPDSLLLKPRVERLERSLLREALGRAANNQTKAAEILGPVALRPAEEAQAVQFQRLTGERIKLRQLPTELTPARPAGPSCRGSAAGARLALAVSLEAIPLMNALRRDAC